VRNISRAHSNQIFSTDHLECSSLSMKMLKVSMAQIIELCGEKP
jgi:hypothetical protein